MLLWGKNLENLSLILCHSPSFFLLTGSISYSLLTFNFNRKTIFPGRRLFVTWQSTRSSSGLWSLQTCFAEWESVLSTSSLIFPTRKVNSVFKITLGKKISLGMWKHILDLRGKIIILSDNIWTSDDLWNSGIHFSLTIWSLISGSMFWWRVLIPSEFMSMRRDWQGDNGLTYSSRKKHKERGLMLPNIHFIIFRFATEEYTNDPDVISNNFIHLTNFSINKESGNFVNNSNPEEPEVKVSTYNNKLFSFLFLGLKVDIDKFMEILQI